MSTRPKVDRLVMYKHGVAFVGLRGPVDGDFDLTFRRDEMAAGCCGKKGCRGRVLADAALGTPRRHLSYKTGWYGSELVVADRWFPSSKTCCACGHVQDIG